jgi:pimeloyl-ACP methyl ester carboxylesterase
MPDLQNDGLTISYDEYGDGEPVVFLPGTSLDSSMWMASAGAYLPGFRSIMVNLPDTGRSDEARGPYTPAGLAGDAFAAMDAAGVESAHVIGYSLGGAVAQEMAITSPGRVRSLVLVSTWARSDAWLRHLFGALAEGVHAMGRPWGMNALSWIALSPATQESDLWEGLTMMANASDQTAGALARQLECDRDHDALGRITAIRCPTLVVVGEGDWFIPPRYSKQLAEAIPGARLEVVPNIGHGLPIEMPEALFKLVRAHLEEVG